MRARSEISRPDKVLFPGAGLTKSDLARYLERVAPAMLPHLRSRPVALERYPDGVEGPGFFQKDVAREATEGMRVVDVPLREGGTSTQLVVENAATLVHLADLACITVHPWLSHAERLEHPRLLVVDLDPPDDDRFGLVQDGAEDARALLEELGLEGLVMTTGSKGMHVVVPLDGAWTFDPVRRVARALADELVARAPRRYTTEQRRDRRGDRLFLDVARNAYGQTAVAPYSPRPLPDAPVATPLDWDEARSSRMTPRRYTIRNVLRRLGQREDPWAGVEDRGQSLSEAAADLGVEGG